MRVGWKGVFPAATTAFRADGSLDLAATARHFDALVRAGVHGLVVIGTVGENHSLEYGEKLDVLRAAVETAGGRVPVLAGVAQNTTALACRFEERARILGIIRRALERRPGAARNGRARAKVR